MGDIKGWILGICFAALVCSLLEMLFPNGNMEKSAKFITALFFLCAMVIPAAKQLKNTNWDYTMEISAQANVNGALEDKVSEQLMHASEKNLERLISDLLEEQKIIPDKISVTMDTDETGCIVIKGTEVYLKEEDGARKEKVKELIFSQLGMNAMVVTSQDR